MGQRPGLYEKASPTPLKDGSSFEILHGKSYIETSVWKTLLLKDSDKMHDFC